MTDSTRNTTPDTAGLVAELRSFANGCRGSIWQSRDKTIQLCDQAADALEAQTARAEKAEGERDAAQKALVKINAVWAGAYRQTAALSASPATEEPKK